MDRRALVNQKENLKMKMMKKWNLVFWMMLLTTAMSWGQTSVRGVVSDQEIGEVLIGANVVFHQDGLFKYGASTNFEGFYQLTVEPGIYDVTFSYLGYVDHKITGVVDKAGRFNTLDIEMRLEDFQIT